MQILLPSRCHSNKALFNGVRDLRMLLILYRHSYQH
jgi:hypothetical protein